MLDFGRGSALPLHRKKVLTDRKSRPRSFHAFARTDKTKVISLSFVFFVCLILGVHHWRQPIHDDSVTLGEATVWGQTDIDKEEYQFVIVTDLDQMSRVKAPGKPMWKSILKFGSLHGPSSNLKLSWSQEVKLTTRIAEGNRGLELSELVAWQGSLYTFDDRSGIAFEVMRKPDSKYECIPRYILTEGDGAQSKGQKTEWATVKDGSLYVGSFGKEYTKDGVVLKRWNLWINIIDPNGKVKHVNWEKQYELLRQATGSTFPGYMVHEAIHWDPHTRQWFVLPRRVSSDPYDEKLDEKKGSNLVLVVDEFWTSVKSIRVGPLIPERGWSSFKFLPGSKSSVIVALKTAEDENKSTGEATQESFITVFDLDGNELIPQIKIPGDYKYEGIEFI